MGAQKDKPAVGRDKTSMRHGNEAKSRAKARGWKMNGIQQKCNMLGWQEGWWPQVSS